MRRSGFSLIELLVAIGVGGAVMTIAIGLIHRSMTVHTAARRHDTTQQSVLRLARAFREDVHHATGHQVDDTTISLQATTPTGLSEVTYTFTPELVSRRQTLPSGGVRRDSFALPGCSEYGIDELTSPLRLALTIGRAGDAKGASPRAVLHAAPVIGAAISTDAGEVDR